MASSETSSFPRRVGYIRMVGTPDRDEKSLWELIRYHVRQPSLKQLATGHQRHLFLFSAFTALDQNVLGLLLSSIQAREPSLIAEPIIEWPGMFRAHPTGTLSGVCRADLELRLPSPRAETKAGRKLLQQCRQNGIRTLISGDTDEECDNIMLEESHYLIDLRSLGLASNYYYWLEKYAKPGIPQYNSLSSPEFKNPDYSRLRLGKRYAAYGWLKSSGCSHGNGEWRCKNCGGKCKRGKCKVDVSPEQKKRIEEREKDWQDRISLPEPGDKRWKDITSADLCERYRCRGLTRSGNMNRWVSIDTFSGE
ncbi:hypothetical protein CC78DRAFT_620395 [Lojkania enalia]|uniref:Uncharacterized protein n=1 Tax=Lojkania enalia TaxID=147567 RepID=A0A9P4K2T6_9PLEO|nr:hypothetical protein CC78DRAFT_620395 [Didymosphaeria enalia]